MITISEEDYHSLWQTGERIPSDRAIKPDDPIEVLEVCPQALGTGERRWIALREFDLLIHNYTLKDALLIQCEPCEGGLEFGFRLQDSGNATNFTGQNFVQRGFEHSETVYRPAGERILQVDIHLDSANLLNSFMPVETEPASSPVQQFLQALDPCSGRQMGQTTIAMQVVLRQLLDCPYHGLTRQIYLESKCWELIALKLEQFNVTRESHSSNGLKADDFDRIYAARAVLICNWQNPPTLSELARQVGLNEYKLKLGFRQVFGVTAFGYLWHYRMERASELLTQGNYNIREVATMVGYVRQSSFAAAFRKKFGINPKVYQEESAYCQKIR